MNTISPASVMASATGTSSERSQLKQACQQFEAIFVRQMLASARKASFGDELFGSNAVNTFRDMQDNQYADIMAKHGSLGLASQIEAQVARFLPPSADGKG